MTIGAFVKYDIFIDNKTFISSMSNGHKTSYKISTFGNHTLTGINKKGEKKEISIDINKGGEYYIRCGVDIGKKYGTTQFSMLCNETGYAEYHEMR